MNARLGMSLLPVLLVLAAPALAQDRQITDMEAYRRRMAEIELMVSVDRNFEGAAAALAELDYAVSAEIWKVVVEPDVHAARKRIEAAIAEARRDDGTELEQSIADAMQRGDEAALQALGPRAGPLLRRSLQGATGGPLDSLSPEARLIRLCIVDEPLAWDLLAGDPLVLGVDSAPWVLQAVADYGVRWRDVPFRPMEPERPEWLEWFALLLEQPGVAAQLMSPGVPGGQIVVSLVRRLAAHEAITPRLSNAIITLLRASDGSAAVGIVSSLDVPWHPGIQPILEAAVQHPRDDVRRAAAGLLVRADLSPGLRSRVADPDVDVRLRVVESLGARRRGRMEWGGRNENDRTMTENVPPARDPEALELVSVLAADREPAVREAVARLLETLDPPAREDVYISLASDPDVQVRQAMVAIKHPDSAVLGRVLGRLAQDEENRVVQAVDYRLTEEEWDEQGEWLTLVLRARLANAGVELGDHLLNKVTRQAEAMIELTRVILETNDSALLARVADAILAAAKRGGFHDGFEPWCQLARTDLATLCAMLDHVRPAALPNVAFAALETGLAEGAPDAIDPLARDASRPVRSRLALCALTLHAPDPGRVALLHELLGDLPVGAEQVARDDSIAVRTAIASIPGDQRNEVIRGILESIPLHRSLSLEVAAKADLEAADGASTARLILDRLVEEWGSSDFVMACMSRLARSPEYLDEDLLRRALQSQSTAMAVVTVQVMARLRDDSYIPLLRDAMDTTWRSVPQMVSPTEVALEAVAALQGYMSDEAAAVLIDVAAMSPSAKVREAALLAVEAIGRYRDAQAAWQRRTTGSAGRDAAIVRLAEIAGDADGTWELRAEAIRGLGTLQAVEHLPLVIEALLDPESRVREAAREALQRINEWKPTVPPAPDPAGAPVDVAPPPGA